MKYFESKNALFCRNFYQIVLLFLKNPACKFAIFISQNRFHKNLDDFLDEKRLKSNSSKITCFLFSILFINRLCVILTPDYLWKIGKEFLALYG